MSMPPPGMSMEDMLNGPGLPPPGDEKPDFSTEPPLNGVAYFAESFGLALATFFVIARLITRSSTWRRPHPVDIMLIVAYALFLPYIYFSLRFIGYGLMFIHQWDVQLKEIEGFSWILFRGVNFYMPAIGLLKAAILFEWARIFVPTGMRNAFWWACMTLATINLMFYTANLVAYNLACTPYEKNWNKLIPGKCIDVKATDTSSAVINLTCDLVSLVLPQRIIWNLKLPSHKKLSISLIFGIGLLACVAAAFRLEASIRFYVSDDATYTFSANALWGMAEITCGFIILCAPAVPGAWQILGYRAGLLSTKKGSDARSKGTGYGYGGRGTSSKFSHPSNVSSTYNQTQRSYRRRSDDELALTELGQSDDTIVEPQRAHHGDNGLNGHIVRTTDFYATEDYVRDEGVKEHDASQYPWAKAT